MTSDTDCHVSHTCYLAIRRLPKEKAISELTALSFAFQNRHDLSEVERQAIKTARHALWEVDTLINKALADSGTR